MVLDGVKEVVDTPDFDEEQDVEEQGQHYLHEEDVQPSTEQEEITIAAETNEGDVYETTITEPVHDDKKTRSVRNIL